VSSSDPQGMVAHDTTRYHYIAYGQLPWLARARELQRAPGHGQRGGDGQRQRQRVDGDGHRRRTGSALPGVSFGYMDRLSSTGVLTARLSLPGVRVVTWTGCHQ
jgi:hypothetical protein